jgi:hypothetical protein
MKQVIMDMVISYASLPYSVERRCAIKSRGLSDTTPAFKFKNIFSESGLHKSKKNNTNDGIHKFNKFSYE